MAFIKGTDISVLYPLNGLPASGGAAAVHPDNLIVVGSQHYICALSKLNFEFNEGQRVGLIGRNGSGKSTLLRVLGGIYAPTGGVLRTDGRISSLFNLNLGVQPDETGRQNIIIRGLIKGWSRRKIMENMDDIIAFSELEDFIDLPFRTYSDGMRMRLLFAIATSFSPEILLLDEWIGAGDAKFQTKAAERMRGLVSGAGITVIASHNRSLLRNVCDIGMWLDYGVLRAIGPIDEVYKEMDAHFARIES